MNTPQRDLLAKTLADIAKGLLLAVLIALATKGIDFPNALFTAVGAIYIYIVAHKLL